MDKQVILAVAGSGKTYTLCHTLNPENRNLILAFTNQNIYNLKKELTDAFGEMPLHTKVMTFHSFIYQFFICPYEPTIKRYFNIEKFQREGISFKEPPKPSFEKNGRMFANKAYHKKDEFEHYEIGNRYYCCLMTELILEVKNKNINLLKIGISNLKIFFDYIYIDEFQDFREYDYDFLMGMVKNIENITMVGDYYQHSVSGKNNSGKPFKKKKSIISYDDYLKLLEETNLIVDYRTLCASRRCPKEICSFISKKLGIRMEANNNHNGEVIFVELKKIDEIIKDDSIKKIVYFESDKYKFNSINWGYSKGDTYDKACVILTEKFDNIDDEDFLIKEYTIMVNKLYVALSRTRGNLYIIKKRDFDLIKMKYLIN